MNRKLPLAADSPTALRIKGSTRLAFCEDVCRRFEAYGLHAERVEDGNDPGAIERALRDACPVTDRPSLIRLMTHIGYDNVSSDHC